VSELLKQGYTYVVDADLESFFDTIPHDRLNARLAERISDGRVLELIDGWLRQDIMIGLERWRPTKGTPQGAVLSPLLANCYLHGLDVHLDSQEMRVVRYADDFVVLCRNAQQAQAALGQVQDWVQANGLKLHAQKTHVGDAMQPGQGFEFLGYRFEAGRRWVRKKSMQAIKDRIRGLTRRTRGDGLARAIEQINAVLRGWYAYFKHARPQTFRNVDGFVRRRLRSMLRKQRGQRARSSRALNDHRRWPNAYFAEQGLFTLQAAHASASRSRCS